MDEWTGEEYIVGAGLTLIPFRFALDRPETGGRRANSEGGDSVDDSDQGDSGR